MFDNIRIFLKTVDLGSFSKAGQVLQMAPSSVSRAIDRLELELGVTLFKRSTRRLTLTTEGHAFYEGAVRLVADADDLVAHLRKTDREPEGTLRISVFSSFGNAFVCPLLPAFLRRYSKVKVDIDLDDRVVDVIKEDIDLAIRIGRPLDSQLQARRLLINETLLCASPAYFEQHGRPDSPQALTERNCLLLSRDRQKNYWHFRQRSLKQRVAVQGNLRSRGGTALLHACLAGSGIAQLPRWMVHQQLNAGILETCLPDWQASLHEGTSGEIYLVYPRNRYPSPLVRIFIDFLVHELEEQAAP